MLSGYPHVDSPGDRVTGPLGLVHSDAQALRTPAMHLVMALDIEDLDADGQAHGIQTAGKGLFIDVRVKQYAPGHHRRYT